MELYLMQHGLCLAKELDPEQSLSLVGRDQVEKCAHAARRMGLELDALVTSPKKRAQQTAAILSEAIRYPKKAILVSELVKAMTPPQDTLAWLRELGAEREARRVGVVGHMPSLGELVSLLITPGSRAAIRTAYHSPGTVSTSPEFQPTENGWFRLPPQFTGTRAEGPIRGHFRGSSPVTLQMDTSRYCPSGPSPSTPSWASLNPT